MKKLFLSIILSALALFVWADGTEHNAFDRGALSFSKSEALIDVLAPLNVENSIHNGSPMSASKSVVKSNTASSGTNCFDASTATLETKFYDDDWQFINTSYASWDVSSGTLECYINETVHQQWKAQAILVVDSQELDNTSLYRFSCKITSNHSISNVTIKVNDIVTPFVYTNDYALVPGENQFVAPLFYGGSFDGKIVFDLGFAQAGDIVTISDISLVPVSQESDSPLPPTFSVASGTYMGAKSVELACETEGAAIYYTLDGTNPTAESTLYSEAILLSAPVEIRAIAISYGIESEVVFASYNIELLDRRSITYTADAILAEVTGSNTSGLHIDRFYNGSTQLSITSHTFSNGTGTITFSDEVTTIGKLAFSGCSGLTSVTIPDGVTTIGQDAFYNCTGLTSVTIPDGVTTIGNYAFSDCTGLTSVTIGSGVTEIGYKTFWGCSGLTSVTIGSGVTTIDERAFVYCTNITDIYCNAQTPPTCNGGDQTFSAMGQFATTVHVPTGTVDQYKVALGWRYFYNITDDSATPVDPGTPVTPDTIVIDNTPTLTVLSADETMGFAEILIRATAEDGYEFVRWNDGNTDNPRVVEIEAKDTFVAYFKEALYTVTVLPSNEAYGSVMGGGTFQKGQTTTLIAIPAANCTFTGWSDGVTDNPRVITVTGNISLVANFVQQTAVESGTNATSARKYVRDHQVLIEVEQSTYDATGRAVGN